MSEFENAIGWRGPNHLSLVAYGIWEPHRIDAVVARETAKDLTCLFPTAQVAHFIATDEGWPFDVGVFDFEFATWSDEPQLVCANILEVVCRRGARLGWMMFEGVFNDVADVFSADWAPRVYAIRDDCGIDRVDYAIADPVRHSSEWRRLVLDHRQRLFEEYPTLGLLE